MNFEFPNIEPNITKEYLLSKNSEETYMSTYLGLPVKKGLQVSPLRNDKRPTASFYRNKKGDLIFHDFGTGFNGNFISVVMELNHCNYFSALRIIAKDFGYIKNNENYTPTIKKIIHSDEVYKEKAETVIQVQVKDFSETELKWWESFGVNKQTLEKYNVYSCESIFINGQYFGSTSENNPAYGYYGGKKNNIELWRIYFPRKKTYRFISNWNSRMIQGIKQLTTDDYVIITKSLKDVMVLNQRGINACAPNGEAILIYASQFKKLQKKYQRVFVLFDNDLPGVKGAHKYKKEYGCHCIFIKRKFAKDISDLHKSLNNKEFKQAISELKEIVTCNPDVSSSYFKVF